MLLTVKPDFRRGFRSSACTGWLFWLCGFLIAPVLTPFPAHAAVENTCDTVARQAAKEADIPLSVLRAITRTETGRKRNGALQPWPWTVNMEGEGHWFDTEDAARAYVFKHFKRGARSFDVGCFQINFKWHGGAFRSIDQMFDPLENARYAASFLRQLHDETGDWSSAAGAYHSRTPKYANRYRTRFDRILNALHVLPEPEPSARTANALPTTKMPRQNTYPLLRQSGGERSAGSLVSLGRNQGSGLIQWQNQAGGS